MPRSTAWGSRRPWLRVRSSLSTAASPRRIAPWRRVARRGGRTARRMPRARTASRGARSSRISGLSTGSSCVTSSRTAASRPRSTSLRALPGWSARAPGARALKAASRPTPLARVRRSGWLRPRRPRRQS
eukprot:4377416-Pyramimonas_sp.AAC.1